MQKKTFLGLGSPVRKVDLELLGYPEPAYIRYMTAAERDEYWHLLREKDPDKPEEPRYRPTVLIVIYHLCDEKGKRLLSMDDIEAVNNLNTQLLDAIVNATSTMRDSDEQLLAAAKKN